MAAMQCYFRGNANDGQAGLNAHRDILQADLDHVRDHWNTHYIRKSRHNTVPGRPDELLYIPENSGFKDFRCPITKQQLDDMAVCCTTDEEENIFLEYSNYGLESLNFAPSDKLEREGKSCSQLFQDGFSISDLYAINPDGDKPIQVLCDRAMEGGGWTVFQRRWDGSVDFYLGWESHKNGFGNLNDSTELMVFGEVFVNQCEEFMSDVMLVFLVKGGLYQTMLLRFQFLRLCVCVGCLVEGGFVG
ncbi:protein scabrous-like [Stylophora pistillata]|uniref:protein scabrous-like n=1 Tax=Stylophora pistillata TaxID=50429 RepID=UPI000C05097E|nr:protein scabrous-like [Stylophora pistillata]